MTKRAGNRWPRVRFASPVFAPPRVLHSASSSGPAARWMAPSTPPPPSNDSLAALTMASTSSLVMSPRTTSITLGSRTHYTLQVTDDLRRKDTGPLEAKKEPPVVARLVVEIRSDGSHTIARGAAEDVSTGERVSIQAEGATP